MIARFIGTSALIAIVVSLGCGSPRGRGEDGITETEGDEAEGRAEDDASAFPGGTWAPRASLARVEEIPRGGKVEERPSRTGAVRLIALMPVDGTGNHVVEIVGLPALDGAQVVVSLRASHDQPRWVGCDELVFVADGAPQAVDGARHEGGVSTLGVMEAIQGRMPLERLEAAARATLLVVKSCENDYAVAEGPGLLSRFVTRFRALTVTAVDVDPTAPPEETTEDATDVSTEPTPRSPDSEAD